MDVQELLSDSGIGREMHVIVGQGKLDEILQSRPEDRRAFIEEAAGVLKHRKRKEKALRKLDAMAANLARLTDLTTELRRQLKPLGRQAEVARRAQTIQADLRDARLRLAADDLVTGAGSSDSAATSVWPAPRSPHSATRSFMWPPASPTAPAKPGYASTPSGGGPQRSRPPGNTCAPPSDDRPTHRPNNHERHLASGKPAPPGDTGQHNHAVTPKSLPSNTTQHQTRPTPITTQNRG